MEREGHSVKAPRSQQRGCFSAVVGPMSLCKDPGASELSKIVSGFCPLLPELSALPFPTLMWLPKSLSLGRYHQSHSTGLAKEGSLPRRGSSGFDQVMGTHRSDANQISRIEAQ